MIKRFITDSLLSFTNNLANKRNQLNTNEFVGRKLDQVSLRSIYKTGLANKIVRIKSSYAMNNTLSFSNKNEEIYYNRTLSKKVREAVAFMIAFGRAIIILHEAGSDLSDELPSEFNPQRIKLSVFSGDMVSVSQAELDLQSDRYNKPTYYNVRGYQIHYTRVIDFVYVEPTDIDKSYYSYGGISEYELIYNQLVGDAIVERSSASILEKNSTLFYKLKGFSNALQAEKSNAILTYFELLENNRSIYGAGIIDSEDEVMTVDQSLTNLKDVSDLSLRRVAMVTDIPLAILIGENVKGLNSTGDNELRMFGDAIKNLQQNYIVEPINEILALLGRSPVEFKEVQWESPTDTLVADSKILDNAIKLEALGEDFGKYLRDRQLVSDDGMDDFFPPPVTESDDFEQ